MNFAQRIKTVEPFNLFGERAIIYSKDEAAKILKDNSYYIFFAACLMTGIFVFLSFNPVAIGFSKNIILLYGIIYFVLGIAIRYLKSRVASILAMLSFGWVILLRIIENDTGGSFFLSFIFLAASYRSVRASFYYHKHT